MKTRLVGFAALLALFGVVAGVPWLLLRWGADLTPDQLTLTDVLDVLLRPDDGTAALVAITVIAWIAWAVIGISVAVELVAVLRGVTAPRLPGLSWPQWGAHQLVAAAALLFATASLASSAGPAATPPAAAAPLHGSQPTAALDRGRQWLMSRTPALAASGNRGAARTHLVRTGDTLWGLAERYLGDGTRYRELARLNADQLDGQPDLLHPGTRLRIPNVVRPRPAAHGDREARRHPDRDRRTGTRRPEPVPRHRQGVPAHHPTRRRAADRSRRHRHRLETPHPRRRPEH